MNVLIFIGVVLVVAGIYATYKNIKNSKQKSFLTKRQFLSLCLVPIKDFLIKDKKYTLTSEEDIGNYETKYEFDTPSGTSSQVAFRDVKEYYIKKGLIISDEEGGKFIVKDKGDQLLFSVCITAWDLGVTATANAIISVKNVSSFVLSS